MHYSEAEIDIPPKITLQPEFFLWSPFSLVLRFFVELSLSTMKYSQNNNKKKCKNAWNDFFSSKFHGRMFNFFKLFGT